MITISISVSCEKQLPPSPKYLSAGLHVGEISKPTLGQALDEGEGGLLRRNSPLPSLSSLGRVQHCCWECAVCHAWGVALTGTSRVRTKQALCRLASSPLALPQVFACHRRTLHPFFSYTAYVRLHSQGQSTLATRFLVLSFLTLDDMQMYFGCSMDTDKLLLTIERKCGRLG